MNLKEKVLNILNNNVGKTISGAELAKQTEVSRNSIWKAINSLKNEGYEITSTSNVGYTLNKSVDIFNESSIKSHLKSPCKILIYNKEGSSNTIAKRLTQEGESEGTVVIVKSQTEGRGRLGRSFISTSENGVYMSIILKPSLPASEALNITIIGAIAVAEAIERTSGIDTQIKWVNDIYMGKKKVSGILTEAGLNFENGMLDYAVIGIGVNVLPPDDGFAPEIEEIATSIYKKSAPCGYKARLVAQIIDTFFEYYNQPKNKAYIEKYRKKSNIIGKEIEVSVGNELVTGVAVDIDDNANLVVRTSLGERAFYSGEARIKRW
ncbi:MAG: biotin--[Clostridia bacterium]|nr:biotin--[acetyl-CoA-carboxylase] ligase [Clostridia bacterium]